LRRENGLPDRRHFSRGADKEGADLVLASAPNADAIVSTINGVNGRGKLLIVAAPHEPFPLHAFALLSGKTVAGWPSGSLADSEDTMNFSALKGRRVAGGRMRRRRLSPGVIETIKPAKPRERAALDETYLARKLAVMASSIYSRLSSPPSAPHRAAGCRSADALSRNPSAVRLPHPIG
jgi:hypothetical protein